MHWVFAIGALAPERLQNDFFPSLHYSCFFLNKISDYKLCGHFSGVIDLGTWVKKRNNMV